MWRRWSVRCPGRSGGPGRSGSRRGPGPWRRRCARRAGSSGRARTRAAQRSGAASPLGWRHRHRHAERSLVARPRRRGERPVRGRSACAARTGAVRWRDPGPGPRPRHAPRRGGGTAPRGCRSPRGRNHRPACPSLPHAAWLRGSRPIPRPGALEHLFEIYHAVHGATAGKLDLWTTGERSAVPSSSRDAGRRVLVTPAGMRFTSEPPPSGDLHESGQTVRDHGSPVEVTCQSASGLGRGSSMRSAETGRPCCRFTAGHTNG
jgi:hypothetical protein